LKWAVILRSAPAPCRASYRVDVLEAILYRGELPRGEVAAAIGASERQARRIVSALMARVVLRSASPRAALPLVFPAALSSRWMPGLFPEN
jgi:hypothetical protein